MATLYDALQLRQNGRIVPADVIAVLGGSLLLATSAHVAVPFYPVPLTLQTFVAIGLGLALGPAKGAAAVLAYIMQGVSGLPVFAGTPANGVGIAYLLGPTGGFLLGFVVQAYVAGRLSRRGWSRNVLSATGASLIAAASIYPIGLLWLGAVIGFDKPLLALGLFPFVLGDLVKALLAGILFPAIWSAFVKAER